jgi:formylglycine-generating enzyme required for sulfatase activity
MSEVYYAERRDHDTLRRAVIKFPKAQFSDDDRQRFIREMQALNQLEHENIARLYDYGTWEKDGRPYLIIKYIEGQSLRELLKEAGPLPVARVVELTQQVSAGLSAAHALKLLHRDLKPENIMLTREGVVLFELLTGQRPFGGTEYVVIHKHLTETPPSLRQLQPSLPAAVDSVVQKALAKDPPQRQPSIQQLAEELRNANVTTQPDLPVVQVVAPSKRKLVRTAMAAGGVIALAVSIGVAVQQYSPTDIAGNLTPTPTVTPAAGSPTPTATETPAATPDQTGKTPALSLFVEDLGNDVKLEMVAIKGGTFTMGSPFEYNVGTDQFPQHSVRLSPFYIGKYEVTQAQWEALMGSNNNRSYSKGDNLPVENVSWIEANEFCKRLSNKTGKVYRLPTEAEWEYSCRAGSNGKYGFGDDAKQLGAYAWYHDNSGSKTHPVGKKLPNRFGLSDMLGNVWEWCQDWYGYNYYQESSAGGKTVKDPRGPSSGRDKVRRGGNYLDGPNEIYKCRCDNRDRQTPDFRNIQTGLRVACEVKTQ